MRRRSTNPIDWYKVTIWCKNDEWERMNYLASSTGKTLSHYVLEAVLKYEGAPPTREKSKECGKVRSLIMPYEKWQKIKELADAYDMSTSKYVVNIILDENRKD